MCCNDSVMFETLDLTYTPLINENKFMEIDQPTFQKVITKKRIHKYESKESRKARRAKVSSWTKEERDKYESKFWTENQKIRFLEGLELNGKSWTLIAEHIGTKTHAQTSQYGKNLIKKLRKTSDKTDEEMRHLQILEKPLLERWNQAEEMKFLEGLRMYGKDYASIQKYIGTKQYI